jgi:hypothetical protein
MVFRERRPAGGERLLDPGPVQRDAIEVALDDHDPLPAADALERVREPVERLALAEQGALGRVQVLRVLARRERAAAEGDDAPPRVPDREHHAPAQQVVVAAGGACAREAGALRDLAPEARPP